MTHGRYVADAAPNKSFDRSANSAAFIRETRMPPQFVRARSIPPLGASLL